MTHEEFLKLKEGDIVVCTRNNIYKYCRISHCDEKALWGIWYDSLKHLKDNKPIVENTMYASYKNYQLYVEKPGKVYGIVKFMNDINTRSKNS
jgi:hypothetical protein